MKTWLRAAEFQTSILTAFAVGALCVGCRSSVPAFSSDPGLANHAVTNPHAGKADQPGRNDSYRFLAGDLVGFYLPESGELLQSRIRDDGTVTLPSLGTFVAAGKTSEELHAELVKTHPRIRALVPSGCYHVSGEVKAPGLKPYASGLRLSDAIRAADGFTDSATTYEVILRHADGRNVTVKLAESVARSNDPLLHPGDSISVQRRGGLTK